MDKVNVLSDDIALGFSVQYALDEGKGLAFQSCVPLDCAPAHLDAMLDKIIAAAERQSAKFRVVVVKREHERLSLQHHNAIEDMFRLDVEADEIAKRRSALFNDSDRRKQRLSPAEIQEDKNRNAQRGNAAETISRMSAQLDKYKEEIATLEAVIAANSTANMPSGLPNS